MDGYKERGDREGEDLGLFIVLTTLEKIGEGKVRQNSGDVLFPVDFTCIIFKLFRGEIIQGEVDKKILKQGVFVKCGPVESCYLSHQKLSGYHYVPGENPVFMSDKLAKIDKGVSLRVSWKRRGSSLPLSALTGTS
uniref:DNA-directed RNA polymerase subunit n=1 Tax=Kalanchoe fedtschenkoi TaxID=63787 RepID=A0A7N0TQV7_KALFE